MTTQTQEIPSFDLIDILRRFNRKERFFLVGEALGNREFLLSEDFRAKLGEAIEIPIPTDAFAAMDYHLDWIAAGLAYHANPNESGIFPNDDNVYEGGQRDIDFLVAFKESKIYHLVLLEAKGYSEWDKSQMNPKAERLKRIFGDGGDKCPEVKPHFWMVSARPSQLNTDGWPAWMSNGGTPRWLELELPNDRLTVTRCSSNGISSDQGDHFRIGSLNAHNAKTGGAQDLRYESGNPNRITKAGKPDQRYLVNKSHR